MASLQRSFHWLMGLGQACAAVVAGIGRAAAELAPVQEVER